MPHSRHSGSRLHVLGFGGLDVAPVWGCVWPLWSPALLLPVVPSFLSPMLVRPGCRRGPRGQHVCSSGCLLQEHV